MRVIAVTAVVPVKNEEKNLASCLARLSSFKEVLVVDSDSTDRTREIAEAFGAKIIDFAWQGGFPKKRNWVLLNYKFSTQWVLFVDADEQLTDEFLQEMSGKITEDRHVGFWTNYRNHFLGRVLKYGVPQRKLALFRVGAGLFERIDEVRWSNLDMEVHEHPILSGSIGQIMAPIDHLDFRGLEHFLDRHNAYSTWEANRFLQQVNAVAMTPRQTAKYKYILQWWFPLAYFVLTYVMRLGFLDGRAGYVYAVFKATYYMQVREKILEITSIRRQKPL
jgi:glycosyltransferase involved in cell wall biosynthesis